VQFDGAPKAFFIAARIQNKGQLYVGHNSIVNFYTAIFLWEEKAGNIRQKS
jgi:hypothetical protein